MILSALHTPGDVVASRYRIVALLGKGGMSETYEAEDLNSYQRVALKVLSLRQMTEWKTLDLFEREAKVLAQLDHPGIPNYLDSFDLDIAAADASHAHDRRALSVGGGDRHFYIVRELVSGESLGDRMAKGWRPTETDLKDVATQILHILIYLHRLSPPLIHRDIKPANIIRQPDGTIYLVDFGAVQEIYRETFLGSNTFVGTAGYMPPEQFRGQTTAASDLYSLGATLLYLATQRTPDQLPQSRMTVDVDACTHLSASFTQWLSRLLEPIAEDRFTSADSALKQLQAPRPRPYSHRPQAQLRSQAVALSTLASNPSALIPSSHPAQSAGSPSAFLQDRQIAQPPIEKTAQRIYPRPVAKRSRRGQLPQYPQKPVNPQTIVARSPQRFHLELPLRPKQPRQPLTLLSWILDTDKALSVGDWILGGLEGFLSQAGLGKLSRCTKPDDYIFLLMTALVLGSAIIGGLALFVYALTVVLVHLLFNPVVLIPTVFMIGRALVTRRAKPDTFTLDITPYSYHFRYLNNGRVTSTDGGDSQQLDIVLGDRWRAYRSSALGCVLVDRAAKQHTSHAFGHNLSVDEQDWLVHEISSFLASIQNH